MAKREDIRERVVRINPQAREILDVLDEELGPSWVTTTEDMSKEEKELELINGFMQEGYSLDEAREKAAQWLVMCEQTFDKDPKDVN